MKTYQLKIEGLVITPDNIDNVQKQLDEARKEFAKPKYNLGDVAKDKDGVLRTRRYTGDKPWHWFGAPSNGKIFVSDDDITGPVLFNVYNIAKRAERGEL